VQIEATFSETDAAGLSTPNDPLELRVREPVLSFKFVDRHREATFLHWMPQPWSMLVMEGEYQFERRQFWRNPEYRRLLAEWLIEQEDVEVVMESTAQY